MFTVQYCLITLWIIIIHGIIFAEPGLDVRTSTCYIGIHWFNIQETGLKVSSFAGFYYHNVMTTSAHTHAYHYSLFESETKTDLCMNNHFVC